MPWPLLHTRERDPLTGQQSLDAVRVTTAITPREQKLAVPLAAFLLRGRRHVNDAPDSLLTRVSADEHAHQLARIEPIGLCPALAAVDLDARGVDNAIGDPATHEVAMEPKAVASRFVTAPDWRV